ncbi:ABC transporter permease [bacterium]|nr:ABC transporter permease [bacterium]
MHLSYEFFIARRYLKARSKTGFINLVTYISILGVVIGVAALIIVLSVMNGLEYEVRSRITGFDAHIRLRKYHFEDVSDFDDLIRMIQDIPHITGLSPYIDEKGILKSGDFSDGIIIRAADPLTINEVSDIAKNIVYGSFELGMVQQEGERDLPGIVVGRYLADRLFLSEGDKVFIINITDINTMFQVPDVKTFVVTGYFETGMYEYDNTFAYISIEAAQELFRMGNAVTGIEIRLDDLYKANAVVEDIDKRLGFPYFAETWFDMRKNLFHWIQLEKWAMFIVLCLIILVAAFNIISTLIMVVMDKTREIGILKSMGSTSKSIRNIFLYESIVVGVIGTIIGFGIGYTLCWAQLKYRFFTIPGEVYFINTLPVKMEVTDFIFIGIASIVICLLAGVYPAKRASNLIPVEAIRYE